MDVVAELTEVVGAAHVVTDPQLMQGFTTDWTGRFTSEALAVVSPADTREVADVIAICHRGGIPVHPQGGNTSLVGGSVPSPNSATGVILSTVRLTSMADVDRSAATVTVGAGATLESVQAHARDARLYYGVDIAARSSATIGGTIATNAGGIRVCAFGMTREQVVGLEAVLPSGEVVSHLAGLPKDNTGLDWPSLFIGSEGTLGVITAVTLRLHEPTGPTMLVLVAADSMSKVQAIVGMVAAEQRLLAAEVMEARGLQIVEQFAGLAPLFPDEAPPYVVLIEVAGDDVSLPDDADVVGAIDATDRQRLWRYRELQSEAAGLMASEHGVTITKLDISVPLASLAAFAESLPPLLDPIDGMFEFYSFGHVADGNLHVEIAASEAASPIAVSAVLKRVAAVGGSISAEHGIGRAKAHYLHLSRSVAEIDLMRTIKSAIDPDALMAPGVIFETAIAGRPDSHS